MLLPSSGSGPGTSSSQRLCRGDKNDQKGGAGDDTRVVRGSKGSTSSIRKGGGIDTQAATGAVKPRKRIFKFFSKSATLNRG